MIQQLTVTTESAESIKPLLEAGIREELKTLQLGINRTRERISGFERQYGMTTGEFVRRFDGTELKETLDFIEWSGEIKTLRLLEEQAEALQNIKIT